MARDTAPRLTFCYGGHDWNVTVWGGQGGRGWAGDAHLLRTHGDKSHWGGSLSLFMDTPVATGLIWLQDNNLRRRKRKLTFPLHFDIIKMIRNPFVSIVLERCGRYMLFFPLSDGKQTQSPILTSTMNKTSSQTANILPLWLTLNISGALWGYNRHGARSATQELPEPTVFPYNRKGKWTGDWPVFHPSNSGPHLNRSPEQRLWRLLVSLATRSATVM